MRDLLLKKSYNYNVDNYSGYKLFKAAEFFIQCESCRRIVWLTGLKVVEDIIKGKTEGKEVKLPTPTEIITIVVNNPEIKTLAMPCANEMIAYYKGMSEQDKTELKNKIGNIVSCIVSKVLGGQISPIDLPIPDDIEFPDGFPTQFPTPDGKIPGMDDMINTGIDIFNKTKDELSKRFPGL